MARLHYDSLTITTVIISVSFILMAILTMFTPHRPILPAAVSGIHPFLLLYFGIAVTVVTFALQQLTIQLSSATTASLTNYIQPVFSFTYNAIFIGEMLTPEFLFGSVLVLVGVFIATSQQASSYVNAFRTKRRNG